MKILLLFFICFNTFSNDKIIFIGDSNTALYHLKSSIPKQHPSLKKDMRFTSIVARNIDSTIINAAAGSAKTRDFFNKGRFSKWDKSGDIYFICLGLNDSGDLRTKFNYDYEKAITFFKNQTLKLINSIKSLGAIPVLMTNIEVDYQNGHFSYDRNGTTIDIYDDVYRRIAKEKDINIFDINKILKKEISIGNWDFKIRNYNKMFILNDSLDYTQGESPNPKWYTNVHYNINGSKTVAKYLKLFIEDTFKK